MFVDRLRFPQIDTHAWNDPSSPYRKQQDCKRAQKVAPIVGFSGSSSVGLTPHHFLTKSIAKRMNATSNCTKKTTDARAPRSKSGNSSEPRTTPPAQQHASAVTAALSRVIKIGFQCDLSVVMRAPRAMRA
jgi:hypothetical protein